MIMQNEIKILLLLSSLCLTLSYKNNNYWPYPQSLTTSDYFYLIDSTNFTVLTNTTCELLLSAIARTQSRLFTQNCAHLNPQFNAPFFPSQLNISENTENKEFRGFLSNVTVNFNLSSGDCPKWPTFGMSEKYQILVNESRASIEGESVWGALRGLETFSQMVVHVGLNQFAVNIAKIDDFPKFPHRGLLIDTSRHFLPLNSILQTLDAMEMNKLNVLHWHIVDDQSFPFVSKAFPDLAGKGSYNPITHTYSVKDIEYVLEAARLRGIRLLMEFDTPGHTQSWGLGAPGLLAQCYDDPESPIDDYYGPVDPSKNSTFEFLGKFFSEVVERFPDQFLHVGGDEVHFRSSNVECWLSNPGVSAFMKEMEFNSTFELERYYIEKLITLVQGLNRTTIVWQDAFDNNSENSTLPPETVVQVWKPWGGADDSWKPELESITGQGLRAIYSSTWYLDVIGFGADWHRMYEVDPRDFNGTAEQKELVIGGEACMWGEVVNGANVISRVWPRASAMAERLWSSVELNSAWNASTRFHAQHCRIQKAGLRAGPIDGPGWCACDHAL